MLFGLFDTEYIALYCPAKLHNNQIMAVKCFDDTNILKLFIRFSRLS